MPHSPTSHIAYRYLAPELAARMLTLSSTSRSTDTTHPLLRFHLSTFPPSLPLSFSLSLVSTFPPSCRVLFPAFPSFDSQLGIISRFQLPTFPAPPPPPLSIFRFPTWVHLSLALCAGLERSCSHGSVTISSAVVPPISLYRESPSCPRLS